MNISIGGVVFDKPLVWTDREDWAELAQTRARTVGGGQVVFTAPLQGGRPITLEAQRDRGWISKTKVDALRVMAAQIGATFTFVYGLDSFDVEFDHSSGPALQLAPLIPRTEPAGTDFYTGTIRLRTV